MRKWSPLIAVCLGTFLLLVDVTIVVVALPSIADKFGADYADLQWVLDGYALALAALLLGAGSLADRYGRRRTYLAGIGIFAISSLLCAVAPNEQALIAARVLQGIGGAAMFACTAALLNVTYQGRDRGVAFGVWGAVNGAAAAAGPLAGGLLTEHLGWRWVFLVNLPVCLVAVWFTVRGVTESKAPWGGRFDLPGTVTFTVAAAAVTYGLIRAGDAGWTDGVALAAFAAGAVALVAFLVAELRSDHPMLDLSLFKRVPFATLILAAFLTQAAAFGYLPFSTVWLQQVLRNGPVDAGLQGALPMAAASLVVGAVAGRFLQRVAPRWTVGLGLLLIAAGDLLQARLDADSTGEALIPGLIVVGVGVGCVLPSLSSAILGEVPRERSGMAGGALNTFRQLGFALGVAVFGTIFADHVSDGHGQPVAFADGLNATLLVAGGTALVAAVLVLIFVRPPAPARDLRPAESGDLTRV
ncbi:EmrB/QacA subfamily drug resistance transporter [Actinoplanes octamycinicus]|uniref:EmrB/QacA subfamily drug resistance transporter n=1 Tax=Actinoplanes octamycinicus TaxID=135948 RepID=A0A7W7GY54_9ACTN|nr:MFS transporter [Actinoplanes octamycinicus]MBB4740459.1 EmrB/QacA subfamily drug resistance transporter [Actinoplanes octamycinicus]GIE59719.1 MFS transporter [Actinoplanes octamycinicus]